MLTFVIVSVHSSLAGGTVGPSDSMEVSSLVSDLVYRASVCSQSLLGALRNGWASAEMQHLPCAGPECPAPAGPPQEEPQPVSWPM